MPNSFIPNLEWPEMAISDEREVFYESFLRELRHAEWVAVLLNPTPFDQLRKTIEGDCQDLLKPIELGNKGLAWVCPIRNLRKVLPGLFHARRPEMVFLAFEHQPQERDILNALQGVDAAPAQKIFFFEEGELVEIKA